MSYYVTLFSTEIQCVFKQTCKWRDKRLGLPVTHQVIVNYGEVCAKRLYTMYSVHQPVYNLKQEQRNRTQMIILNQYNILGEDIYYVKYRTARI